MGDSEFPFCDLFLWQCVRAFTESILDLTTASPLMVDYLGKEELIYLGPDENIIPQDIEWIINRAVQRNYILPQACTYAVFCFYDTRLRKK